MIKTTIKNQIIETIDNYKYLEATIVLCTNGYCGTFVEASDNYGLLVCCDVTVAKLFLTTESLIKWVEDHTNLKVENGDFKIEGQYLPGNI